MSSPDLLASQDDEISRSFPGWTLTHVFCITADSQLDVALEALGALKGAGANLCSLSLSAVAGALDHRMKVTGIKPSEARTLSDSLARLPGVMRITLEHVIGR